MKKSTKEESPVYGSAKYTLPLEGINSLDDFSLLETLLVGSSKNKKQGSTSAKKLWDRFSSFRELEKAGIAELVEEGGISEAQAFAIKASLEMGRRLSAENLDRGEAFVCSRQIWRNVKSHMENLEQEEFWVFLLDQGNRLLRKARIHIGTLNSCKVSSRDIFSLALREKAASIILVHNHPSGNPEPSAEDRDLTRMLGNAGKMFDIRILDHLVIGHDKYVSFADRGYLMS